MTDAFLDDHATLNLLRDLKGIARNLPEVVRIARALIATAGDYIHDRELAALVQGRMIECTESMLGRTVAGE